MKKRYSKKLRQKNWALLALIVGLSILFYLLFLVKKGLI